MSGSRLQASSRMNYQPSDVLIEPIDVIVFPKMFGETEQSTNLGQRQRPALGRERVRQAQSGGRVVGVDRKHEVRCDSLSARGVLMRSCFAIAASRRLVVPNRANAVSWVVGVAVRS